MLIRSEYLLEVFLKDDIYIVKKIHQLKRLFQIYLEVFELKKKKNRSIFHLSFYSESGNEYVPTIINFNIADGSKFLMDLKQKLINIGYDISI